jgi:hypothetical protein
MAASCLLCRYKILPIASPIGVVDDPVGLCEKCSSLSCGHHGERTSAPAFLCILCDIALQKASAGWDAWVQGGGLRPLPRRLVTQVGPSTNGSANARQSSSAPVDAGGAPDLAEALARLFSTPDGYPSPLVVRTLEDWAAARPDYRYLMAALANYLPRAIQAIEDYLRSDPDGYQSRDSDRSSATSRDDQRRYGFGDVRSLWERLDSAGQRLLAAAALLILALDLPLDTLPAPVADVASLLGDVLRDEFSKEIREIRQRIESGG